LLFALLTVIFLQHKLDRKMIRTLLKPTLLLLLLTTLLTADVTILEFVGVPARDKIILNWRTGEEIDVDLFIVERSVDKKVFVKAGEVLPKGNDSEYEFIDTNLASVNTIYYYRLSIRRTNGTFQLSEVISVIPKISSFAKTWGSIKALFQ
jgi:fibronectin type 3 domain-containing protein